MAKNPGQVIIEAGRSVLCRLQNMFPRQAQRPDVVSQRRRHPRVATNSDVVLRHRRQSIRVSLRDFSARGMRIAMSERVDTGSDVTILSATGEADACAVQMRVVWCRAVGERVEAGLTMVETPQSNGNNLLQRLMRASGRVTEDQPDRRNAMRVKSNLKAGMQVNANMLTARVLDISRGGACLDGNLDVKAGDVMSLFLPPYKGEHGFAINARVLRVTSRGPHRNLHVQFIHVDDVLKERLKVVLHGLVQQA